MVGQWQTKKKVMGRTRKHVKYPINLTLKSKFKVVSGSWMYTTHCLMVIHLCAKYGKPMSNHKKVMGRKKICTDKRTDRRTDGQTDRRSDSYISPWSSFAGGIKTNQKKLNKKCFRNTYALLGAKFKTTTYTYKAWVQTLHRVWYWSCERVKRYWANTQSARKSGLTLTFEHVTWKSIGIIYSLRATPAPSLVLIKSRGQKILSGQHTGLKRVVWPWPLIMWSENH